MKAESKALAIKMRKTGATYNEILKKVPVSKSSLSLWLRPVELDKKKQASITEKRAMAREKGWKNSQKIRLKRRAATIAQAKRDIGTIGDTELFYMGIMLYWAEGAKEKQYRLGQGLIFSNSDAQMIQVYISWLQRSLRVKEEEIACDIYLHDTMIDQAEKVKSYWIAKTGLSRDKFVKIYYKKNKIRTVRKNIGEKYHGLLRVKVRKSSSLNRQVQGWIQGICDTCGIV